MRRAEVAALGVGLARRLFALTLATSVVMASSLLGGRAQAQNPVEEARYQYFFLIDASGSMVGQPQGSGNAIIFPQVKENVIDLVGSLEPGTDVYIAPFHRGIQADEVLDIEVRSDEDKDALKRHVSGLNANGQVTWIYHSLASVFQIAENARKQDPGVRHVQTIYLFTDGKDNSPAGMELPEILRRFRLQRSDNSFLYLKYITLGTTADSAWNSEPGVEVQSNPAGELVKLLTARISPAAVDFGNARETGKATRRVTITYDERLEGVELRVGVVSEQLDVLGVEPRIEPESFVLSAGDTPGQMKQDLTLVISDTEALVASEPYEYLGSLAFSADVPGSDVDIVPKAIDFSVDFEPIGIVSISLGGGDLTLPSLGVVDPHSAAYTPTVIPMGVTFNDRARSQATEVVFQLDGGQDVPDWVYLRDADGASATVLRAKPDSPEGALVVDPPTDAVPGAYSVKMSVTAPEGTRLQGEQLQGGGDSSEPTHVLFQFEVTAPPPPPPSLVQRIIVWLAWLVGILLLALVAVIVAITLKTGSSPGRVVALVGKRLAPRMMDARLEILRPQTGAPQVNMTGRSSLQIGSGASELPELPIGVRFVPRISLLDAKEELRAEILDPLGLVASGQANPTVRRGSTGEVLYGTAFSLMDCDRILVESDQGEFEIEFMSTYGPYRP